MNRFLQGLRLALASLVFLGALLALPLSMAWAATTAPVPGQSARPFNWAQPLDSRFGLLLTLKIALALSVFSHFMVAMTTGGSGERITRRFRRIHISVFCHMVAIVLLAKGMFYFGS